MDELSKSLEQLSMAARVLTMMAKAGELIKVVGGELDSMDPEHNPVREAAGDITALLGTLSPSFGIGPESPIEYTQAIAEFCKLIFMLGYRAGRDLSVTNLFQADEDASHKRDKKGKL